VGQLNGKAFYYFAGTPYPLGGLGSISSSANAINDREQIVGWYSPTSYFDHHAFLYQTGSVTDLGTLGSDVNSEAEAISQDGHIVGWSGSRVDDSPTAFIDYQNVMTDLNTFLPANSGWHLENATGITDSGLIVGNGRRNGGDVHAFLLDLSASSPSTPDPAATPEPGTWAMLAGGTLAIVLRRRHLRNA
jgi:probable HAF family extracellular repeat protein